MFSAEFHIDRPRGHDTLKILILVFLKENVRGSFLRDRGPYSLLINPFQLDREESSKK